MLPISRICTYFYVCLVCGCATSHDIGPVHNDDEAASVHEGAGESTSSSSHDDSEDSQDDGSSKASSDSPAKIGTANAPDAKSEPASDMQSGAKNSDGDDKAKPAMTASSMQSSSNNKSDGSDDGAIPAEGKGEMSTEPSADSAYPDITFQLDLVVPAGAEMHRCMFAQFPSTGVTAVNSVDSHFTPGSHHFLAYRTDLNSIPEDQAGVWPCDDGPGAHMRGSYYEAQQPDEHRQLPEGIAHEFQPGETLLFEAHYLNPSDNQLNAHVEMIAHTMNVADVKEEAGTIFFNDVNIMVPPHGTSTSMMACVLPQDISLALLWSHMHSRGTHFIANTDDPGAAAALGTLYEEADWSEPKPRTYPSDPPVVLHRGSHITFACDFKNDTDKSFVFGQSAMTNEMCILHGMYWPRMSQLAEQCIGGMTARK